jgi:hypothetical protein
MQRVLQVAHRRERLEGCQWRLRERIKETRIGELIEQHFHDASKAEVAWIDQRVRAEYEARHHYYDETFTLTEMIAQGLPGVRREMLAKPSKWRHVFLLWRVLTHVPEVVIVWAIYGGTALTSQYQVIVFSSIVIIYTRFQQWIRASGQIDLAHTDHRD